MTIEILMPALSPTMEEGTLAKWLVKEGDKVSPGDLIAEIETDKATMEVEAVDEGVVGKILVDEGTEGIKVNTPIGIILEVGEDKSSMNLTEKNNKKNERQDLKQTIKNSYKIEEKVNNNNITSDKDMSEDKNTFNKSEEITDRSKLKFQSGSTIRIFSSPLARRIASDKGIDLSKVNGSGPNGRIIKKDVENFITVENKKINSTSNELNSDSFKLIKHTSIRKVIANRLTKSVIESPHFYLTVDCNLEKILIFRSEINNQLPDESKISLNDFIIKATGATLIKIPEVNVSWENEHTKMFNSVDISVAVAVEKGLITPIIKDVANKGLQAISLEMKNLVKKANEGSLLPEEYMGGTFSISNLGMFGIKHFTSIINPPQGAILAVGSGIKTPIIGDNDEIYVATMMNVTLSCDHRVIDGVTGAKFLSYFKNFIENPSLLIL